MPAQDQQNAERTWPAVLGWGGLALFSIAFAWLITSQLGESWAKKEDQAINIARQFRPPNSPYGLGDLMKVYTNEARKKNNAYVGEFQWSAVQKDGPDYEVTLLWKEGDKTRVAIWRVDLKTKDVRPQGDAATSLPSRAQQGAVEG
jgi:hypothetical protein